MVPTDNVSDRSKIPVIYMSGAGNLFSVIDNRSGVLSSDQAARLAPTLCDAVQTIGTKTEGLLLLEIASGSAHDFDVRFYNPDGSTSMMCGNGARCAVNFAASIGVKQARESQYHFLMAGKRYVATLHDGNVDVVFGPPLAVELDLELEIGLLALRLDYLDVGSDHVVILEHDVYRTAGTIPSNESMKLLAQSIRYHARFARGVNVNFLRVEGDVVHIRTYERGVEEFTGACGTGAIASALSLFYHSPKHETRYRLIPPSLEELRVTIDCDEQRTVESVHLIGPARIIGSREFQLATAS